MKNFVKNKSLFLLFFFSTGLYASPMLERRSINLGNGRVIKKKLTKGHQLETQLSDGSTLRAKKTLATTTFILIEGAKLTRISPSNHTPSQLYQMLLNKSSMKNNSKKQTKKKSGHY